MASEQTKMLPDITVITGPMCSGKTSAMARSIEQAQRSGSRVRIFFPVIDNRRGGNILAERGGPQFPATPLASISDVIKEFSETNVHFGADTGLMIVFDECQFWTEFSDEFIQWIKQFPPWVKIIFAGLNLDARKQPFGPWFDVLSPLAKRVIKQRAWCANKTGDMLCLQLADFTYNEAISCSAAEKPIIQIGDREYIPVCEKCFDVLTGVRAYV